MQYLLMYIAVSILFAVIISLLLHFSPLARQDKEGFHVIKAKSN